MLVICCRDWVFHTSTARVDLLQEILPLFHPLLLYVCVLCIFLMFIFLLLNAYLLSSFFN